VSLLIRLFHKDIDSLRAIIKRLPFARKKQIGQAASSHYSRPALYEKGFFIHRSDVIAVRQCFGNSRVLLLLHPIDPADASVARSSRRSRFQPQSYSEFG